MLVKKSMLKYQIYVLVEEDEEEEEEMEEENKREAEERPLHSSSPWVGHHTTCTISFT